MYITIDVTRILYQTLSHKNRNMAESARTELITTVFVDKIGYISEKKDRDYSAVIGMIDSTLAVKETRQEILQKIKEAEITFKESVRERFETIKDNKD